MMREVERDREEGRGLAGSQQRVGRGGGGGAGRGILQGWKSIPLDGVTSRAQLALARVSFRRGFRVLTVVDWRFLPAVSFLPRRQLYMYIACVMRWAVFPGELPLVDSLYRSPSSFSSPPPPGIFFLFYPLRSASRALPGVHYPIF